MVFFIVTGWRVGVPRNACARHADSPVGSSRYPLLPFLPPAASLLTSGEKQRDGVFHSMVLPRRCIMAVGSVGAVDSPVWPCPCPCRAAVSTPSKENGCDPNHQGSLSQSSNG